MAPPLSFERGRHIGLLLLLLVLLPLHLASAIRPNPPSGINFNRHVKVVKSEQELNEADEYSFVNKLPKPIKEAILLEFNDCRRLSEASYERCVYDRRALIADTADYSPPGRNPNPVIGSPSIP